MLSYGLKFYKDDDCKRGEGECGCNLALGRADDFSKPWKQWPQNCVVWRFHRAFAYFLTPGEMGGASHCNFRIFLNNIVSKLYPSFG
jgi:hypothetical protein